MGPSEAWYQIDEVHQIDSPALVFFRDRIKHNIDQMIEIAGDPARLMPHIKTYKMSEIVKMQMDSGINMFKCATIAEAELLGLTHTREALLAYQPSEVKTARLIELIKNYPGTRYSTIIDNADSAEMIQAACAANNIVLDVYLDINNGNNRTGIIPDKAFGLFCQCLEHKAINMVGLHVYDGHIRVPDFDERKKICDQDYKPLQDLISSLQEKINFNPKIIAGGSPTFPVHALRKNVICSPGTTLLWDAGYGSRFKDMPFLPAAVLITRVVSNPEKDIFCLDLGHKSIASENPLENRVRFLNNQGLEPVGHSEEHFVIENTKNISLNIGDELYGLPYHICPTTALYNEVLIAENHKIIDHWEVLARKRKINF